MGLLSQVTTRQGDGKEADQICSTDGSLMSLISEELVWRKVIWLNVTVLDDKELLADNMWRESYGGMGF